MPHASCLGGGGSAARAYSVAVDLGRPGHADAAAAEERACILGGDERQAAQCVLAAQNGKRSRRPPKARMAISERALDGPRDGQQALFVSAPRDELQPDRHAQRVERDRREADECTFAPRTNEVSSTQLLARVLARDEL